MQSLAYATETNDNGEIISCIINASIPLKEQKQYEEAAVLLKKLLQVKSVADKKKAIASIELADMYARQHNSREAYSQIQKARDFLSVVPPAPDRTETYKSLLSIEGFLSTDNKPLDALHAYQKAIDSAKAISPENLRDRELGKIYIAMGNVLQQMHSYDSALLYYNRALYTVINIDTLDKFSVPQQKDLYAENTIAEALYARANCIVDMGADNTARLESAVNAYKLAFWNGTETAGMPFLTTNPASWCWMKHVYKLKKPSAPVILFYQQTKKQMGNRSIPVCRAEQIIHPHGIDPAQYRCIPLPAERFAVSKIAASQERPGHDRNGITQAGHFPQSWFSIGVLVISDPGEKEAAYLASENDLRIRIRPMPVGWRISLQWQPKNWSIKRSIQADGLLSILPATLTCMHSAGNEQRAWLLPVTGNGKKGCPDLYRLLQQPQPDPERPSRLCYCCQQPV